MARTPDHHRLERLQGTLDMLVLRTLQWGPRHGHGIGQAIRAQSDDLLKVETGSLYPALHRLVKRGWLKTEWGISEANQRAKYYQLTPAGRRSCRASRIAGRSSCTRSAHHEPGARGGEVARCSPTIASWTRKSAEGELALVSATPDRFTEVAPFKAIEGKTWNHPALVGDVHWCATARRWPRSGCLA